MKTLVLGDYTITFTPSYTSFRSNDKYFKLPNTCAFKIHIEANFNHDYTRRYYYLNFEAFGEIFTLSHTSELPTVQSQYNELISLLESYSEPSILD